MTLMITPRDVIRFTQRKLVENLAVHEVIQ